MAHKKALGSAKKNRDSISKRLGVKIYGGQVAKNGDIIIRQRGTKYRAGEGVRQGKDDTLYSVKDGTVQFLDKKVTNFTGLKKKVKFVEVR